MFHGLECFLMLLSILAVGAILAVPVALVVMMRKLMNRQREAAERNTAQFDHLRHALREQAQSLKQLLRRRESAQPEPLPTAEPMT